MTMTPIELKSALEAIIYAADEPATIDQLASVLGEEKHVVRAALDELVPSFASDERGVEIRAVAGGYRVYTKPQHHDLVRRFIKSLRPPLRLTMPALETLAVIAYKQPVTQPEIQEIRGVNCAGVIETLLEKRLITTAGRKQVIGRPILYRTSKDFLMRFGLGDVDELPSLKEFEALAREALGSDDGIAVEPETPEGEPLAEPMMEPGSPEAPAPGVILSETKNPSEATAPELERSEAASQSAPRSKSDSAEELAPQSKLESALDNVREVAGEAMGTVLGSDENASRSDNSRAVNADANTDANAEVAGEKRDDSDRVAKKAAPGSSD
jgi:segregation and condensation protein B